MAHTTAETPPCLLPKLQTALSYLYDPHSHQNQCNHQHEAHQFLLTFKTSNSRRQVVSRLQSQKDKVGSTNNGALSKSDGNDDNVEDHQTGEGLIGSVYLSCLALLLQNGINAGTADATAHQQSISRRIFAAQTLNHRCRSIKLVESLDIEAEDGIQWDSQWGVGRLVLAWEEIRQERDRLIQLGSQSYSGALSEKSRSILRMWLERYVPMVVNRCNSDGNTMTIRTSLCNGSELLAIVIERNSSSLLPNTDVATDGMEMLEERGEERIKGTLAMLTLAVAMYSSAFHEYEEEHWHVLQQQHPNPSRQQRTPWASAVLSELGSALSITALRMRYRPTITKHATPPPNPSCPPLIDLLTHSIGLVRDAAESYFSSVVQKIQQGQQFYHQHAQSIDSVQMLIQRSHHHAVQRSIAACLTALPETVLLPPGQESGHRIPSVDRACLRAASMELRTVGGDAGGSYVGGDGSTGHSIGTGMDRMWKVLTDSENISSLAQHPFAETSLASATRLLECCEAWSRFVTVPLPVIDASIGNFAVNYLHIANNPSNLCGSNFHLYQKTQNAAFQYLTSLFEGATPSITPEDILAATLGVGAARGKGGESAGGGGNKKKSAKKKQGKSKKRYEARLGRAITNQDQELGLGENSQDGQEVSGTTVDSADEELLMRKNAACTAAAAAFGIPITASENGVAVENDWGLRPAASSSSVTTHGICSTVSIGASSVLPHLLFLEREEGGAGSSRNVTWRSELFSAIMVTIRTICESSDRNVRGLAYEPLMLLHTALNSVALVSLAIEQIAVDSICECTLALAVSCGYPAGYFNDLSEDNDEELEIERNDIRDVLRSVSSLDSGNFGAEHHKSPSILILEHFIHACNSAIQGAASNCLPPETAVHTLSALAKPLNKLGSCRCKEGLTPSECVLLTAALSALGNVCDKLNALIDSLPMKQSLPVSRLALMGTSSLSPLFSALAEMMSKQAMSNDSNEAEKVLLVTFENTLRVSLQSSILASATIPELVAASTLDTTRYDIKGAMRGPGGEDHVGCIALMKLCYDSDSLANTMLRIYGSSILQDLSNLYQKLKLFEQKRAPGCVHGEGVTPMSRRLILKALTRLAIFQMRESSDQNNEGRSLLHQLLHVPLNEVSLLKESPMSTEKLYRLCEAAFDLAYFSPELLTDLFRNNSADLGPLFECVVVGYSGLSLTGGSNHDLCLQWGRLRGGLFWVMRSSIRDEITEFASEAIIALIKAECEAAMHQCNQGSSSGSNIFIDSVIGEEMVNSGCWFILVSECLNRISKRNSDSLDKKIVECQRCLAILKTSSSILIPLVLHLSSEATGHLDPRPAITEAWFLAMTSLVSVCQNEDLASTTLLGDGMIDLFGTSLSTASALLFLKDLGSKRAPAPDIQKGQSLDGPQTLAMMDFASDAMLLGPNILSAAGINISTHLAVNTSGRNASHDVFGAAILMASLLRAASGALPPWAVECIPSLFRSMYNSLGNDCDKLIQVLSFSTELQAAEEFLGVQAGQKMAGRYFEKVNANTLNTFLSKTREACNKGEWKRLKVILKSNCGGKKKDSGFNLKPQFTCWECERI